MMHPRGTDGSRHGEAPPGLRVAGLAALVLGAALAIAWSPASAGPATPPVKGPSAAPTAPPAQLGLSPPHMADPRHVGVGIPQLALVLIFAGVVFYVVNWTLRDVRFVGTDPTLWGGLVLGGGLAALGAALLVPIFAIGLPLGILVFAGAVAPYVKHRNALVTKPLTVLTKEHVERLKRRLARQPSAAEADAGPLTTIGRDIVFVGMDDLPIRTDATDPAERQSIGRTQHLLFDAIVRQASLWGLMITPQKAQIRLRIEGEVVEGGALDRREAEGVSAFMKRLAGLDPAEVRKPQEGRLRAAVAGQTFELRVKTSGSVRGEQIGVRIIDLATSQMSLEQLGFSAQQLEALKEALLAKPGLVILSGPRNCGLTTTLQAALRNYDRYMNNVVAFEPHVEMEVENVTHLGLNQEDGPSAANEVRQHTRMAPDIVAIDSLNSPEVAPLIVEQARERRALAALRAGDAGEALARMAALLGSADGLAQTVRLVVNQRLVRLLCPQCKEAYRPNPDFIRKANLGSQRVEVLYRPPTRANVVDGKTVECPKCHDARYVGRTGLFELMVIDDEARRLIAARSSASDLRVYARKRSMRNLQEEGLGLVIEGKTSVDEVLRAIKETR